MKCKVPFGHPSPGFHYIAVWFTAQMFHIRGLWLQLRSNTGRIGAGVPSNESKTRLSGSPSLTLTLHSRGRTRFHRRLQSSSLQRHHVGIATSRSTPADSGLFAILDSSLTLMFIYCYLYMEGSCESVGQAVRNSWPYPWRNWNARI